MRKLSILFTILLFSASLHAGIIYVPYSSHVPQSSSTTGSIAPASASTVHVKKMTLKEKLLMKLMHRETRKGSSSSIPQVLYIVLAIFGLAWIAMGIMDNWKGSTWIINLVLTLLFWLPGFIHALIVMKKYYK